MPTSISESPRDFIRASALSLGFDAVGFTRPDAVADAAPRLRQFIADGMHGDMDWLPEKVERRAAPEALWPEVRSVVMLGLNYGPAEDPLPRLLLHDRATISVYAQGADYHDVVKRKLKQLGRAVAEKYGVELKVFVDTAPVLEKPLAAAAGLGWQGKHTNMVSRDFGSWLFLGALFTTLDLEPDAPADDACGTCHACLDICPTSAFPAPYRLDARRCISYLTIEHKGHIATEFRRPMGNRIYGCDDCLAVCPWNKFAERARETAFEPRAELHAPRLADLAQLDEAGFRQVFAGSPVKRIGRDRLVRNVLIALGNSGDAAQRDIIEPLLRDASPLVRAMAVWALAQLVPNMMADLRAAHLPGEADDAVRAEWATS